MSRKVPSTLTAMTRDQTASLTSCSGVMSSMIPATFASPSTRPSAAATIFAIESSEVMSPATATAPGISATAASRRSCEMSTATTFPPSAATRAATARPIPEPAPVTMTVLPSNRPGVMRSTHGAAIGGAGGSSSSSSPSSSAAGAAANALGSLARRTISSISSCDICPPLMAATRSSEKSLTGARADSFWPPWASRSRRIGPPTGCFNHAPIDDFAVSALSLAMSPP